MIRNLDVFDRATFVASSSQVTISEIIHLVNSTINALQNFKSTLGSIQRFRNDLLTSLKRRYQSVETEKVYALGTILDPRFKGSVFLSKENLEKAKSTLTMEISDISILQADDTDLQSSEQSQRDTTQKSPTEQQGVHSM